MQVVRLRCRASSPAVAAALGLVVCCSRLSRSRSAQLNTGTPGGAPGQFQPLMPQPGGGGVVLPGNFMASPFSPTGPGAAAGPGNAPVVDNSIQINGNLGVSPQNMMDQHSW